MKIDLTKEGTIWRLTCSLKRLNESQWTVLSYCNHEDLAAVLDEYESWAPRDGNPDNLDDALYGALGRALDNYAATFFASHRGFDPGG